MDVLHSTVEVSESPAGVDVEHAVALAASLSALAAMVTEHPQVAADLRGALSYILVSVGHGGDNAREQLTRLARAGQASGAEVTEHDSHTYAGVNIRFGPLLLHVYAPVERVHEVTRVVEYTPQSILAEIGTGTGVEGGGLR